MLVHLGAEGASFLVLFFAFVIAHALADFPLQNDFLARSKVPGADLSSFFGQGGQPKGIWVYSLSAHALVHAGGVWLVSGLVTFAVAEFALHWLIDLARGNNFINFHVDQALHILCKVIYVVILVFS